MKRFTLLAVAVASLTLAPLAGAHVSPNYVDPGGYGGEDGGSRNYPEWPNDIPLPAPGPVEPSVDDYWVDVDPEDFNWRPSCEWYCHWGER